MERSREAHRTTRPLGSLLHWRQRRIDPQDRTKFGTENRTGAVAGWPNTENGTTIGGQANQRGGGRRRVHLGGRLEERAGRGSGHDGGFRIQLRGVVTVFQWSQEYFDSNPEDKADRDRADLRPNLPAQLNTPHHISSQTEPYRAVLPGAGGHFPGPGRLPRRGG